MSAGVHARAIRHLEGSLSRRWRDPRMARLVAEADRALTDALAQLGVLTEDERERWNARFAGADAASIPLDGELHDRACAYLRRQLAI